MPRTLILYLHFCLIAVVVTEVLTGLKVFIKILGEGKGLIIVCCLILEASGGKTSNVKSS